MDQQNQTPTERLLGAMYKNVKMGADSILNILPKAEDKEMRSELTGLMDKFEGYAGRIREMLAREGEEAKEESFLTKMGAKMGMAMNTMMDSTTSHLAEMMIEGATMGVTDMTKLVREYENSNCSEEALSLAKEIIGFQEKTVEKMKAYL
ncbi:MAG: hypothetical protein IJY42_04375 [Clostridia bacterium]|nr:hypothetical protein [Clostridia bacterium]